MTQVTKINERCKINLPVKILHRVISIFFNLFAHRKDMNFIRYFRDTMYKHAQGEKHEYWAKKAAVDIHSRILGRHTKYITLKLHCVIVSNLISILIK